MTERRTETADLFDTVFRGADLSDDGCYRYHLWRRWDMALGNPLLTFIMLNPSTADANLDDPTIRRCMGFARALGYGGIAVSNLYAYRATKPADLWTADEPTGGERNEEHLRLTFEHAPPGSVIAAWGAHAKADRVTQVMGWADRAGCTLRALHVTKGGAPGHPLYLPATATPQPWPAMSKPPGSSDGGASE